MSDELTEEQTRALIEERTAQYLADAHAVQTGIAVLMARECGVDADRQPGNYMKHTRVGVDMSKADQGALARLLIAKGVITELEYATALADGMRRERESYQQKVRDALGNDTITLG